MAKRFKPEYPGYKVTTRNGITVIENEFVRWEHDEAQGGELCGAYVKNGTNENLLTAPQTTDFGTWIKGAWRDHHFYCSSKAKAEDFKAESKEDGSVSVSFKSKLADQEGKTLAGVSLVHTIDYHVNGAAQHTVKVKLTKDIDLGYIRIGMLQLRDDMDRAAIRPSTAGAWAQELQNPCQWIELKHGKSRYDLPAWQSVHLPLSMLVMKNGIEGIELAMGDDLGVWDSVGRQDCPTLCHGSIREARDPWRYLVELAPLDSPRAGNIVKRGTYTFTYRVALPFVRKKIVPLVLAGGLHKPGKLEERWPTKEDLKRDHKLGVEFRRLHNDGDLREDGIFWRDVAYPPYPADEMEKMDQCIADAAKNSIDVVPYMSVKEFHPEVAGFEEYAEKCAHQVVPGEKFMVNVFGKSVFGMQMCLCSDWYEIRRKSIAQTLDHHAFNGLYFDWCMGLECIHPVHNGGKRHWDNDQLLKLMEWSRNRIGNDGRLYLHLTNVPSFALENMADMVLTEESEYYEIEPEMFTPHVHFLNIAPRSICVMIPAEKDNLRKLALVTLLHHATLCIDSTPQSLKVAEFYHARKKQLDQFSKYEHHTAPGEGIVSTNSKDVGMSLYWKGKKGLAVLANITDREQTGEWSIRMNGKTVCGIADVPPMDFITFEVEL